jgi:hypothetical protein
MLMKVRQWMATCSSHCGPGFRLGRAEIFAAGTQTSDAIRKMVAKETQGNVLAADKSGRGLRTATALSQFRRRQLSICGQQHHD